MPVLVRGADVVGAVALLAALIGVIVRNPLWRHESVGDVPIFNWLLYLYGLPTLLAVALAFGYHQRPEARRVGKEGSVGLRVEMR